MQNSKRLKKLTPYFYHPAFAAFLLFVAFRAIFAFAPLHYEEMRDFSTFLQTAEGRLPYRDFYWHYGPLAPLVYGTFLKFLPAELYVVRFLSILFNGIGVVFLGLLFERHFTRKSVVLAATLLASLVWGYPNYSHNHVLASTFSIIVLYCLDRYFKDKKPQYLLYGFAAAVGCLLVRPILSGYGVMGIFLIAALWKTSFHVAARRLGIFFILGSLTWLLFYGIFQGALVKAFVPRSIAIYFPTPYPNLHALIPRFYTGSLADIVKGFRTSLETFMFYFHFFVWPTAIFVLVTQARVVGSLRTAFIACALALASSFDVLHYGLASPNNDPAMLNRAPYFFALTAVSLLLFFLKPAKTFHFSIAKLALLVPVSIWMLMPTLTTANRTALAVEDTYHLPHLSHLVTHPNQEPFLEAISFANSLCKNSEPVFIAAYQPGFNSLLECPEVLADDVQLLEYFMFKTVKAGDSPYNPRGPASIGDIVKERLDTLEPKVIIGPPGGSWMNLCDRPGWVSNTFGQNPLFSIKVCWR